MALFLTTLYSRLNYLFAVVVRMRSGCRFGRSFIRVFSLLLFFISADFKNN